MKHKVAETKFLFLFPAAWEFITTIPANRVRSGLFAILSILLAFPPVAAGSAQLVIQASERERWHGEDNLYGEAYGRLIAMEGDVMVTAGEFKVVTWERTATGWVPTDVLDPGIGRISDVSISDPLVVIGASAAAYGEKLPLGGAAAVYVRTSQGHLVLAATLTTPDNAVTGYEVHNFATSVDIDGDTLVVGAPDSRSLPPSTEDGPGIVFVYTRGSGASEWNFQGYLTDDSNPWRYFGASVGVSSSMLLVGAPIQPPNLGSSPPGSEAAAFVYSGGGGSWTEEMEVVPGPYPSDEFARFVAVDHSLGTLGMIASDNGAKSVDNFFGTWTEQPIALPGKLIKSGSQGLALDSGAALYVDAAGSQVVRLYLSNNIWQFEPPFAGALATSPQGVAVSGGGFNAAIGYPFEDVAGNHTGRVVTYHLWDQVDEVLAYGAARTGDDYGVAVDAADRGMGTAGALVGAPGDQRDGASVGAAYLYLYDAATDRWTKTDRWQPDELVAPGGFSAGFGTAVVYNGGVAYAASAPDNIVSGADVGSVFVQHPGPAGIQQIDGSVASEGFGLAIAYLGDHLLVGAPLHGSEGGVYPYRYDTGTDTWTAGASLVPPGLTGGAGAGRALATDGQWLLIGAPNDGLDGGSAGGAFVYEWVGSAWLFRQRLALPPGDYTANNVGTAVAVAGDFAFVGATFDGTVAVNAGAVHVFHRDGGTWTWVDKLTAADGQAGDSFGGALQLAGPDLFVGAPGVDSVANINVGATYPYRRTGDTWAPATTRIVHSGASDNDSAARSLAFANGMLLVGTPGEDGAAPDAGTVVVFDYDAHVEVPSPLSGPMPCIADFQLDFSQRFDPPVRPSLRSLYGSIVDLSNDTMIVTEPWATFDYVDNNGQPQSTRIGGVHVYRRTAVDQWAYETTVFPPVDDVIQHFQVAQFGITAAIDGDLMAVGNWYGKWVYVYERTNLGWELRTRLPGPGGNSKYGVYGLDVSGSTIVVGESAAVVSGLNGQGQVYFYERDAIDAWVLNAGPIPNPDPGSVGHFGNRVAVDSASGRAVVTGDSGLAYVYQFERIGGVWQAAGLLDAGPFGPSGSFGDDLDISGNTVVVGDTFYTTTTPSYNSGAAFVWEHDGISWTGPTILTLSTPTFQDHAGVSVSIDEDLIVIGSPATYSVYPPSTSPRPGAAWVYGRQGGVWSERLRILPDDLSLLWFGAATAVSGGIVAVGTPQLVPRIDGVAYAYDLGCWVDTDGDGVSDPADNCTLVPNPGQCDGDNDGYGNHCDADFNNDGIVNNFDIGPFRAGLGTADPVTDLNCDGITNNLDVVPFRTMFGQPPGPSGLVP